MTEPSHPGRPRILSHGLLSLLVIAVLTAGGRQVVSRLSSPARIAHPLPPLISVDSAACSWPGLFGPHNNSTAAAPSAPIRPWGPDGPPELWRIPCGTGYSSPIVWQDRVVLLHRLGAEEVVSCRHVETGRLLWEQRYPTQFVCGSHYTHGPYSTPTTDGEAVYTLGAEGQLHAWNLQHGAQLWARDLRQEFGIPDGIFGVGHSPLCWNGRLILNVGGTAPHSGVVALRTDTGATDWSSTAAGAAFATPRVARIHDRDWLFVFTRQGLTMLDPATGAEQWTCPFEPHIPDAANAVSPLILGDLVLLCSWGVGTQVLQILPTGDYRSIWRDRRTLTSQYTPLIAVDDCVLGVHATDDSLRCVEMATGQLRWRWKSELGHSKNILLGDQLLLLGEYGHLGLLRADTHATPEACRTGNSLFTDPGRCFSAPAYSAGRLFVRNESELVCLLLAEP